MQNIRTSLRQYHSRAFTLLESLITLSLVAFLTLSLTSGVQTAFQAAEEEIFFLEFEEIYKETQKQSLSSNQPVTLSITGDSISTAYQSCSIPDGISVASQSIVFDEDGGNSSLKKITFQMEDKIVQYQLYIGSGRYKKSVQ